MAKKLKPVDMSVQACMDRYLKERADRRLIHASASMRNDMLVDPEELGSHPYELEAILTWDGKKNIQRQNWKQEYEAWLRPREAAYLAAYAKSQSDGVDWDAVAYPAYLESLKQAGV